jgi:DNA-binding NtrC family response regulator
MGKFRVLLVDDEAEIPRILAKRLGRRGYDCVIALNGREALEIMEADPCPLVILDIKMPIMGGMEALAHIVERWPKTRVIVLSGHADMQLAVQAMTQGAFGYLMKPVDFEALLFKIEDATTDLQFTGE